MRQPTLLVVSGPPCSGKTTLARRLRARLGWPLLEKDAFKEALFDTFGTGDADWSRRLSEAAFARQSAAADAILSQGGSLLVVGNFRPEHHPALAALAARHQAALAQVACSASPATLAARRAARATAGRRHPGHADSPAPPGEAEMARYRPLPIVATVAFDAEAPCRPAALLAALGLSPDQRA
jgi:predicted kinase